MSDVRLVLADGVAHRLRHTLRPPLPPPLAAVRLVAVGKRYASIVDDEKLAFLGGLNIKIPLPSSWLLLQIWTGSRIFEQNSLHFFYYLDII